MILIGLGANLPSRYGEPKETLVAAKAELRRQQGLRTVAESKTYLTAPFPISDDPWYHNQVVQVETALDPDKLLGSLNQIEENFGRVRTIPNAPRVIDLDIIAYDDVVMNTERLTLPHPRMHERAFVLYPLRDVAPEWTHPVLQKDVGELITALPDDQEIKTLE